MYVLRVRCTGCIFILLKFHCYLFICIFLFHRVLIGNTLAKEKEARCFYSQMKLCFFWSRLMSTNSYLPLIIKMITFWFGHLVSLNESEFQFEIFKLKVTFICLYSSKLLFIYYLLTESEVITGKSQTETLMYWRSDSNNALSLQENSQLEHPYYWSHIIKLLFYCNPIKQPCKLQCSVLYSNQSQTWAGGTPI